MVKIFGSKKKIDKKKPMPADDTTMKPDGEARATTLRPGSGGGDITVKPEGARHTLNISKVHDIGRRENQQDSFGLSANGDVISTEGRGLLAVVCDGMGGMADGEKISSLATMELLQGFDELADMTEPVELLEKLVYRANDAVDRYQLSRGGRNGGSTALVVMVRDEKMHWLTVGDSHIYLYRRGDILQVNEDHVYGIDLDQMAMRGEISMEEAKADPQRRALTSYIGMGELKKIDHNLTPMPLENGDRILMMSDGVFGTLTDGEIVDAMGYDVKESAERIHEMIRLKNKEAQDNYTAIIMEYMGA